MNVISRLAFLATVYVLGTTATGAQVIHHSFQFDARDDSPDMIVLDYRYGDSKISGARSPEDYIREGRPRQSASITGPMLRGDLLYVKWKARSADKIYEDTVDLKSRLPRNIEDHIIYFQVNGSKLSVFLISPESRNDPSPIGPANYRYRKMTLIYPDPGKQ